MTKQLPWEFEKEFENEKSLDLYFLTKVQTATSKSNVYN